MGPRIALYGQEGQFETYRAALERAGGQAVFLKEERGAASCQGLLLAGGGDLDPALYGQAPAGAYPADPERDAAELALLAQFTAAGKPVLGICRGMQVINVFFGGTLIQDLPGHSQTEGRDRLHLCRAEPGSLLQRLYGETCVVNSAHHQAVDLPGVGLRVVQQTEDGTAEALVHTALPVIATQWHPERLTGSLRPRDAIDGAKIFDSFLSYCK